MQLNKISVLNIFKEIKWEQGKCSVGKVPVAQT